MSLSTAFLILGALFVIAGVLLFSIPVGLIVAGVILAGAGAALLEVPDKEPK